MVTEEMFFDMGMAKSVFDLSYKKKFIVWIVLWSHAGGISQIRSQIQCDRLQETPAYRIIVQIEQCTILVHKVKIVKVQLLSYLCLRTFF